MNTPLTFIWDEDKAAANMAKHGLSFQVALHAFTDPACIEIDTIRPEDGEERFKCVGKIGGALFTVVFMRRDGANRIISARRSNPKEERAYAGC